MSEEIKINKYDGSITFINNGISFSQFGIAKEILYLIEDLQQKVEQLEKENKELRQQELTMSYDSRLSYLKQRCEYLERSNNRREDEIMSLRNENVDLASKNEQLENIRKEAIEYLEYQLSQMDFEKDIKAKMLGAMTIVLLNKGSDKE